MSDLRPPPLTITRQIATGILNTPISRSSSMGSDRSPVPILADEVMRQRLRVYMIYLEQEIQFLENEIHALTLRPLSNNPVEDAAFLKLREGLTIRHTTFGSRLTRVVSLLEVM